MSETLKSSTRKVRDFLCARGLDIDIRQIPESTHTAADAARAVNCDIACIAKSLVFRNRDNGEPVLIIASGKNRVDLERAGQALGSRLERADADFVRDQTGYAIGGIPPTAHSRPMTTLLDSELRTRPIIWAAAGTPNSLFSLTPDMLVDITDGSWVDLAER